jgi:hypothetical protein
MADNNVSVCLEQRVVKFLVNEGVKPADIYRRLQAQYGGQHFSTDDEVKQAVLGWFSRNNKSFYAEAFQAFVKRWDKCMNVAGGCVEK